MFAFIVSFGHAFAAIVAAAVVGGVLGYAFRGKEHQAISDLSQYGKNVAGQVEKKL
jgi:hypothetical protein